MAKIPTLFFVTLLITTLHGFPQRSSDSPQSSTPLSIDRSQKQSVPLQRPAISLYSQETNSREARNTEDEDNTNTNVKIKPIPAPADIKIQPYQANEKHEDAPKNDRETRSSGNENKEDVSTESSTSQDQNTSGTTKQLGEDTVKPLDRSQISTLPATIKEAGTDQSSQVTNSRYRRHPDHDDDDDDDDSKEENKKHVRPDISSPEGIGSDEQNSSEETNRKTRDTVNSNSKTESTENTTRSLPSDIKIQPYRNPVLTLQGNNSADSIF